MDIENIPVWKRPNCYIGYNPIGDYLVYTCNRDSNILEKNNYDEILKDLQEIDKNESVYEFRANHFLCGYVDYLLVHKEKADEIILDKICEILEKLEDYPIYNEDSYNRQVNEEIDNYWNILLLREKIEYCKECNISIFSARKKIMPDKIYEKLSDEIY